jgi:hypothetical protein
VPIALKSGSLKLLELSEPVQACNGIALAVLPGVEVKFFNVKVSFMGVQFHILFLNFDNAGEERYIVLYAYSFPRSIFFVLPFSSSRFVNLKVK